MAAVVAREADGCVVAAETMNAVESVAGGVLHGYAGSAGFGEGIAGAEELMACCIEDGDGMGLLLRDLDRDAGSLERIDSIVLGTSDRGGSAQGRVRVDNQGAGSLFSIETDVNASQAILQNLHVEQRSTIGQFDPIGQWRDVGGKMQKPRKATAEEDCQRKQEDCSACGCDFPDQSDSGPFASVSTRIAYGAMKRSCGGERPAQSLIRSFLRGGRQ